MKLSKTAAIKLVRENTTPLNGCKEYGYSFNIYDENMNAWRQGNTSDYHQALFNRSTYMIEVANKLINGKSYCVDYRGGSWTDYVG